MVGRALLALLLVAADADGCLVCNTDTGEAVRNGILDDFTFNLLATLAPFPLLFAVVAGLHWGWPARRSA
jgi:hypothetical protein